jgi:hypothetical protein
MISMRDTILKLAWLGVVVLAVGEVALVGGVQRHYHVYGRNAPYETVFFWAQIMMGAAVVVCGVAFVAFLLAFTGSRRILAGTAVLVAALVVSGVVISINAWA